MMTFAQRVAENDQQLYRYLRDLDAIYGAAILLASRDAVSPEAKEIIGAIEDGAAAVSAGLTRINGKLDAEADERLRRAA